MNECGSLLVTDLTRYVKCIDCLLGEGAYLHRDDIRKVFVRKSKVARHGFAARNEEHIKAAKKSRPSLTLSI